MLGTQLEFKSFQSVAGTWRGAQNPGEIVVYCVKCLSNLVKKYK